MKLKSVELQNFRNYKNFSLEFSGEKTLIIGKNAQGKTNLLEAIYYLSSLTSHKVAKDKELIFFGEDFARILGVCNKDDYEIKLDVLINPPKKKVLKVDEIKKNKSSDFLRVLSVVNFCVEDLLLLRGEPSRRRHHLDDCICQIYPAYSEKLSKYNKIRLQKANYLDKFDGNYQMLDVYNAQIARSGANIIFLRIKFLHELEKIANEKHSKIAQNENLRLEYESTVEFDELSPEKIEKAFLEGLEQVKNDEIRRATCLLGPHRDDVSYFINDVDAKKFASQGQQRTIVLALKLAELEIIKEKNQTPPILLLDDVLAELDNIRQNYLLQAIDEDVQTIITSVDTLAFDEKFLKNVEIVKIREGARAQG